MRSPCCQSSYSRFSKFRKRKINPGKNILQIKSLPLPSFIKKAVSQSVLWRRKTCLWEVEGTKKHNMSRSVFRATRSQFSLSCCTPQGSSILRLSSILSLFLPFSSLPDVSPVQPRVKKFWFMDFSFFRQRFKGKPCRAKKGNFLCCFLVPPRLKVPPHSPPLNGGACVMRRHRRKNTYTYTTTLFPHKRSNFRPPISPPSFSHPEFTGNCGMRLFPSSSFVI